MLSGNAIRAKYLAFFKSKGHAVIPSAPLVPENDPTTLFTGSGMQPMLPFLLGQPYPHGLTRLVDSQKCFRAQDIEEVGDNRHDTFFEMLGNWSLGDYFKQEQLAWFYEFLTTELSLPSDKLYVSCFIGNSEIPKDEEAANIWKKLGIKEDHIFYYDTKKNWWARSNYESMPNGEPGGPDSEVFFDFGTQHDSSFGDICHPNCDCGRFMEIGNSVFMTYQKTSLGFIPLEKKNIDFGGGLERLTAAVNNNPDIFKTDLFLGIIQYLETCSLKKYSDNAPAMRIVADHLRASAFLISDGIFPSNKAQGYFLRRLLRRVLVKLQQLGISNPDFTALVSTIFEIYADSPYFKSSSVSDVSKVISEEASKFSKTLTDGLKRIANTSPFDLFQTFGFPPEVTEELLKQQGKTLDWDEFNKHKALHQELSRTAGKGMFKGGLQDQSEITTKYHTATHLIHAALRQILGTRVQQKGSNITSERLRFDFSHDSKMTESQIREVETLVNQKIAEDIPVTKIEMNKSQAIAEGAMAFFPEKYPDITNVYSIGKFSKELCGGPHVHSTGEVGRIKIIKEESAGAGVRRIYASALL